MLGLVRILLQAGAGTSSKDNTGSEALAYACMHPDCGSVLKLLFKCHADTNATDFLGQTALLIASKCGAKDAVADLITRRNLRPNIQDHKGGLCGLFARFGRFSRPLQMRCLSTGSPSTYVVLLGWAALHWAVACEELVCLERLLNAHKVTPGVTTNLGRTPLHLAGITGNPEVRC